MSFFSSIGAIIGAKSDLSKSKELQPQVFEEFEQLSKDIENFELDPSKDDQSEFRRNEQKNNVSLKK